MLLQVWRDCRGPTGNETISRPPWGGLARAIRVHSSAFALKGGLRPTPHSDWNVIAIGPLRMVENAVTRTMHHGGDVLNPAEKAPVEAALRMVTADAAWQCRQNFTGVIMAGKAADLVILDKDPTRVDPRPSATWPSARRG